MIEYDVATGCLVNDQLLWKLVYKVKFLEGPVIRSQSVYDTEDEAWDAAGEYVSGAAK